VGVTPPDDERANYQSDPQPIGQEKKVVGHYTQIVWSFTTQVGCGFAPANRLGFGMVVCRYSPPGNVQGQFPYPPGTVLVPQPGLAPVPGGAGGPPPVEPPAVESPVEPPPVEPPPVDAGAPPAGGTPPGNTGGTPPGATPPGNTGGTPPGATPPGNTGGAPPAGAPVVPPQGADTSAACPGGTITSWTYSSSGAGTPRSAFDSFASKASNIVTSPAGDLGIGATAGRFTLLLARCD
jgi:hypothetical protein